MLTGIVYVHPMNRNRMDGTQTNSLRLFENLCGDNMSGVTIVSSMWDLVAKEVGIKREVELKDIYWKQYMDRGCTTSRFDNTPKSAHSIVEAMVTSPGITLRLQQEIVDEGKALRETRAGASISVMRRLFRFIKTSKQYVPICI